jgi:mono/diheme cytochrome c family protein
MRSATASLALVLLLKGCGGGAEPVQEQPADAAQLYRKSLCFQCHGQQGEGGALGPPLRGLREHWTRERLVAYLADPRAFVQKDPRLQVLDRRYSMPMQAFAQLSEEQRLALADHVLGLE